MKINNKSINYSVNTIPELSNISNSVNNDTVIVTDENQGGVFIYRTENASINNGGTIFNGWTRQYDGAVNVKWFGAKGDNVIDDTVAIQNAINNSIKLLYIPNGNYKVTSIENKLGVLFVGDGVLLKSIAGGTQQLNVLDGSDELYTGIEYMAHFHNKIITGNLIENKIIISGDSTTAGVFHTIVQDIINNAGLNIGYGAIVYNAGHSGENTSNWINTYLAQDLANNPDLYIIRWGVNDNVSNYNPITFLNNLETGLSTIRNSKNLADLSIILMTPVTTADTSHNRDEKWYESIIPGMRSIAKKYNCTFINTYKIVKDGRPGANLYMDNPFGDGSTVHPFDVMNRWISTIMAKVICPEGMRAYSNNNVKNIGGLIAIKDYSNITNSSNIHKGIALERNVGIINGASFSFKSGDNVTLQIFSGFGSTRDSVAMRILDDTGVGSTHWLGSGFKAGSYNNVSGDRALNVTYTNNSNKVKFVTYWDSGSSPIIIGYVDDVVVATVIDAGNTNMFISFLVPPNSTYKITSTDPYLISWLEY